jgi:hypothetical protein
MIVSFNFYYARPGLADAVLRQRLLACDVRDDLKLPRGRVLVRQTGSTDLPDVIWEQRFEDVNGHLSDMDVRAGSAEFEAVRAGMRQLCRRFERPLFEAQREVAEAEAPGLVSLEWIFGSSEIDSRIVEKSVAQRVQSLRLITPGPDLPRWMLKGEWVEAGEALRDSTAGIADRVEHSLWRIA